MTCKFRVQYSMSAYCKLESEKIMYEREQLSFI